MAGNSASAPSLERLREWMAVLEDLDGAAHLLDWDRETLMPPTGSDGRGHQLATLHTLRHRQVLADGIHGDLDRLESHADLPDADRANVRLARREIERARRVPEPLVRETSEAVSTCIGVWLATRESADFATFAPHLARVIALSRETGLAMAVGDEPYDALLDRYEPGATTAMIEGLFGRLRGELATIVDGIDRSAPDPPPVFTARRWPAATQIALAHDIARRMGFDLESGLIGESAHPFTNSPHAGDVRFTTRLRADDPTANVLVTLHELGHALYLQGLPSELCRTLAYSSPSLGADESQSRFIENHVGRRLAFWESLHPLLREHFGTIMDGVEADELHRSVTRVRPDWCRVDADEVTYDLHIVLRFDLELAMIRGELDVADLPDAWDEGMRRLLGVTPAHPGQGCMQDIHWAFGLIGYFPTYTLGNIYAAQLAEALEEAEGPLDDLIRAGAFDVILGFMRERVHRFGSVFPTAELMERATGKPFSPDPFLSRIRRLAAASA